MIRPLHNHVVLLQKDDADLTYGNIIVPDMGKEKALMGEVIAVGPGIINIHGVLIPNTLKVGEIVSISPFGGQKITVRGEEYLIYKEQDILAVIEKEN